MKKFDTFRVEKRGINPYPYINYRVCFHSGYDNCLDLFDLTEHQRVSLVTKK